MKKRGMGISLLMLGGCFLWNPIVGVRDFLPDVIGFLLLYLGISKLADLNDDLASAQRAFRAMLWVGIGEVFAVLLAEVLLKNTETQLNRYEQPVWVLLLSFVFLVLEWCFLLSGWRSFFKGLSDLAEFHGGTCLLVERKGKTACERMIGFSRCFVILKTALTLLPELTVLTSFEKDAENPLFTFDWYAYVGTFRTVAVMLSALVGVIWLARYLLLLRDALRDEEWLEKLNARYEAEILPDKGYLLNRRVGTAFAFFRVGAILTVNLTLLYYEFLPDWIAVLFFLCGGLILGALLGSLKTHAVCAVALLGTGITAMILNLRYLEKFIPKDALYLPDAYQAYLPVQLLSSAETVLLAILSVLLLRSVLSMALKHTSITYEGDVFLSARATDRMHGAIQKKAVIASVLFFAAAVGKIMEIWILQPSLGWIWILQVIVSAASAWAFSSFLSEVAEQIADCYPAKKQV